MNGRGRPSGSHDRYPREKRTKLQFYVDQFLGVPKGPKKDLQVNFQQPCQTCNSCMRVEYSLPHNPESLPPSFVTRALSEQLPSGS